VGLALGLAHQVYEPLMLAKRVEEHARLYASIQQALAKFGDGQYDKALLDRDDYGALLARINPTQFAIEAEAVLEQAYHITRRTQWPLTGIPAALLHPVAGGGRGEAGADDPSPAARGARAR